MLLDLVLCPKEHQRYVGQNKKRSQKHIKRVTGEKIFIFTAILSKIRNSISKIIVLSEAVKVKSELHEAIINLLLLMIHHSFVFILMEGMLCYT